MKKLVIILTILVLNNLKATSQTAYDSTTSIPNTQLRKAINLIEKGKLVQSELDLTKQQVSFLEKRIEKKDSIIFNYGLKDIEWNKFYKNYTIQQKNNQEYQTNTQSIFERQDLLVKRNKRSKWLFLALGLGAGIMLHK
jgi:hypothetical protein